MHYPSFFDQVRTIKMHDPLAEFLGASENGILEYTYADAVKLAGHSCPTIAGAYLMTVKAVTHLYGKRLPERGAIGVAFRDDATAGVTGVMANVAGLITGATQELGFKGIAGRFDRRHLLSFNAPIDADIQFSRTDTGASVVVTYRPQHMPPSPALAPLMQRVQTNTASADERASFSALWQERVRLILIEHADDENLVSLSS
jgi:hypothetical protein